MSAKLKDQARRHEQREEWQEAIDTYLRVLRDAEERDVAELPLYNRVGDLYLRLGQADDAVRYYEQAATQYAEAGLFNNAIALCNKALRYSPGRLDLIRRLGSYSASQGFLTDARHWFIEFAERAIRKGDLDAAFVALDEFAETSEDPETRELLARRMHAHGREEQALDEFRKAYALRVRAGETSAAESLRDEILGLYPDADIELDPSPAEERSWGYPSSAAKLPTLGDADGVPVARGLPGLETTVRHDAPPATDPAAFSNGRIEGMESTTRTPPSAADLPFGEASEPESMPAADEDSAEADDTTAVPPLPGYDPTAEDGSDTPGPVTGDASRHDPVDSTAGVAAGQWVDLADYLGVSDQAHEQTRFFVEESDPSGDEDRDFAELLTQFKAKLSEHLAHDDVGSHYDLGLAFKEMGLYDEAISQFQIALRAGGEGRLRIYEELGHCFLLKQQYSVAIKVLSRATQFEHEDEIELIGVYYLLGRAYEEAGQSVGAIDSYERVMGLDIGFKDVAERMAKL